MLCVNSCLVSNRDGIFHCSTTETTEGVSKFKSFLCFSISPPIVDLGRVLAGIQVPDSDCDAFKSFLEQLDYSYVEETNNPVYKRFLQG